MGEVSCAEEESIARKTRPDNQRLGVAVLAGIISVPTWYVSGLYRSEK